jgi:hypothetical protein
MCDGFKKRTLSLSEKDLIADKRKAQVTNRQTPKKGKFMHIKDSMKVVVFLALLVLLTVPAVAGTINWSITGDGILGSGTLTIGAEFAPNVFAITNVTGTFSDTNNGIDGIITDPFVATGELLTSPDGLYNYDNLLLLSPGMMFDSAGGLLFNVNGGVGVLGGSEINIAGIGSSYQLWETKYGGGYLPTDVWPGYTVNFTDLPEPSTAVPEQSSTLFLMLLGLAFMALFAGKWRMNAKQ